MTSFAGQWLTTFGSMQLAQNGEEVEGTYGSGQFRASLAGQVAGGRLTFTFEEPDSGGKGWFELGRDGQSFAGKYLQEDAEDWADWTGTRLGFAGLWATDFGLLRLIDEGELMRGYYEPAASLEGERSGNELTFRYVEPQAHGQGRFVLDDNGMSFKGHWRPEGVSAWSAWTGERVLPKPKRTWLVVIETPWQHGLAENEYAYGSMVGEFFARCPDVEVRHRMFANEESLLQYCREVMYLAEPVYLLLATHAVADGFTVGGRTVPLPPVLDWLRHASDLRLLHFSACLLMQDAAMRRLLQAFSNQTGAAVSGYSTSVNWGASVIVEFTYLELILTQGLSAVEAAAHVPSLLTFAGDTAPAGSPFAPAGFRIIEPGR